MAGGLAGKACACVCMRYDDTLEWMEVCKQVCVNAEVVSMNCMRCGSVKHYKKPLILSQIRLTKFGLFFQRRLQSSSCCTGQYFIYLRGVCACVCAIVEGVLPGP